MRKIEVFTQAELDNAIKEQQQHGPAEVEIFLRGNQDFVVRGSAQVRAWGSAQVRAGGSAQVRAGGSAQVTAWGSAQVRAGDSAQVTAWGSAQVTAWGSAQVTAGDSAQVTAWGSAQVRAGKYVAVTISSPHATVTGGIQIKLPPITTAAEWVEYYDLPIADGIVVVYKGLDDQFKSPKGSDYTPGTTPKAHDWDNGLEECGGGLHACAKPWMALKFNPDATKFVGCPVRLEDMRAPKEDDQYPDKIKFSQCCAPCFQVDMDGNPITAKEQP